MMSNGFLLPVLVVGCGFLVRPSAGQDCAPVAHRDIAMRVDSGKISTGVAVLQCPENAPPDQCTEVLDFGWRVHPRPLLEIHCNPYFTSDPGTFAMAGSGLPASSQVGFDILDDLRYWDGNGTVSFGPVPHGEQLKIKLGGQSQIAGTGTGVVSGFFFASVRSDGSLHVHMGFYLLGSDGNAVPANDVPDCLIVGDGVQPTIGIYLLQLRFKSNDAGIASSDPVWLVFNNGVVGCMNCQAITYAGAQVAHDRPAADLNFDRLVDLDDLTSFEACVTGPDVPWTDPCCQYADFDHDGDIDQADFGVLQRCYSGPGAFADPACAD